MTSSLRRRALAGAAAAVLACGASGCAGFRVPHIPGLHKPDAAKSKLPGERIPVLALNDKLEPNTALAQAGFSVPAAEPVTDWPQPGGTPEHEGDNVVAAPDLQVAWSRSVGSSNGVTAHVTASPVVADGRIYVMDGTATVSALDPGTGRTLWRTDLAPRRGSDREGYGGGIAWDGGQLFVTSGYRFVAALDAKTGHVNWRRETPAPMHGAPTVADGRLFAVDTEDQLQSFAVKDGEPGWSYQALEEGARVLRASSPAVSGETVVAPFASGEIVALSTVNGSEQWEYVLSLTNRNNALSEIRDIAGRPVIYRGDVLAGSHSGVFASIDLRTGQPRWSLPITTIATPWPAGDAIYVTDQAGQLICISREAGQVYWIKDLNAAVPDRKGRVPKKKPHATWSGPVLASDRLVVVSDSGEVRALDPKTGALLKSLHLRVKRGSTLAPVPVDGRLYIATDDAQLFALK